MHSASDGDQYFLNKTGGRALKFVSAIAPAWVSSWSSPSRSMVSISLLSST